MLRVRTTTVNLTAACACASTSKTTAPHSSRCTATATAIATATATTTTTTTIRSASTLPHAKALQYTAPLWTTRSPTPAPTLTPTQSSTVLPLEQQDRVAQVTDRSTGRSTAWETWIQKSRTARRIPSSSSDRPAPTFARTATATAATLLSSSSFSTILDQTRATPLAQAQAQAQDTVADQLGLVKSYLSLRSSSHALLRSLPRYAIDQLIRATRVYDLPLVENLLLADIRQLQAEAGPVEKPESVKDALPGPRQSGSRGQRILAELVRGQEWAAVIHTSNLDKSRPLLYDILQSSPRSTSATLLDSLPNSIAEAFPELTPLERLQTVWTGFADEAQRTQLSYEAAQDDMHLSLDLLVRLVAQGITQAPPSDSVNLLPFAVQVFKFLSETFIADNAIASTPSELALDGTSALPRETLVRLVLLRTIVTAANEEKMYDISIRAIHLLAVLRPGYMTKDKVELDFVSAQDTLKRIIEDSQQFRRDNYSFSTATGPAFPLPSTPLVSNRRIIRPQQLDYIHLAHSLVINSFAALDCTPPSSATSLPARIVSALTLLSDEIVHYKYYDLLSSIRAQFGAGDVSYWPLSTRVALLRYYGGISKFRVYAVRGVRRVQQREYEALAVDTWYWFKNLSPEQVVVQGTAETRNDVLLVLCSARTRTGRTVDLSIRLYKLFKHAAKTTATTNSFILTPGTLLAMVAAAAPPVGKNLLFAQELIGHYIASVTASTAVAPPPNGTPTRLDHQDLTLLANCYSLVGDYQSCLQVFRRMLEQKMVPDAQDVVVFLTASTRRRSSLGRSFVKLATETGIVITEDIFAQLIREAMAAARREGKNGVFELKNFINLAQDVGLSQAELERLTTLGKQQMVGTQVSLHTLLDGPQLFAAVERSQFAEVRPAVLNKVLLNARSTDNWETSLHLYRSSVEKGVVTEMTVELTLQNLLSSYESSYRTLEGKDRKAAIRPAFIEVIESALSGFAGTCRRVKTFETILLCCLKLDDVEAVWRVCEAMELVSVEPREIVSLKVRRWAIAQVGKEAVHARGGWVGAGFAGKKSDSSHSESIVAQAQATL